MNAPLRLRPSLRRRRWLRARAWLFLFAAFAYSAHSLVPSSANFTASGSARFGFSYIWILTDGTFSTEPPKDSNGLMTSARVQDQYDVYVDTSFRKGGPHPTFGNWFVDPTENYSALVTITDSRGTPVRPIEPYIPLIVSRFEQVIPNESEHEIRDVVPNLKAGNTTWSLFNQDAQTHNLVILARALCTLAAIPLLLIALFTWLIPRRAELRREFLEAGKCPRCEYPTLGLTTTCPECGEPLTL